MPDATILLAGDVMTGRGIDQIMRRPGDPTLHEPLVRSATRYVDLAEERNGPIPRGVDPAYIWGDALDVSRPGSFSARVVNLETAVTDRGDPWPGKGIHYRMHPDNLDAITAAGIDCTVLANNHVLDWGHAGLAQTLASLGRSGLLAAGAGPRLQDAARPATLDRGASRVMVFALGAASSGIPSSWAAGPGRGGVAFTAAPSRHDVGAIAGRVESVARPDDLVIVSIHWGPNWGYPIPPRHRRFARELIDRARVDVVHGHSSHHALGIEVYRNRPILYGCGDLITDYEGIGGHQDFHPDLGILYVATLDPGEGLHRLELIPMRMRRFRLEHAPRAEVAWLAETLSREGAALGTSVARVEDGALVVQW